KRFEGLSVSSITGQGLGDLIEFISSEVRQSVPDIELGLVTRRRYRTELEAALLHICKCLDGELVAREIRAEELRLTSDCLGRITGKIGVEDLLDVIFSEFCVGK
ncbi:MAG: tRNA uridine-5-carboxymethylaminomethyl(34) synthesis GTPase MnmE, partial [Pseudomonadota bacterium]